MEKNLLILLFLLLPVKAQARGHPHPGLICTRRQWAALISSSTIHPWSDVVAAATTYVNGPQADFPAGSGGFGSGNDEIRQQNEMPT